MEEPAGLPIEGPEDTSAHVTSPAQQPSIQSDAPVTSEEKPSDVTPPKKHSKAVLFIIMGAAFILLVSCATYATLQIMRDKIDNNPSADAKSTTQIQTANPDEARDGAITQSLNDIDTGVMSASADQKSADEAVSDSDQQITVPTE